MYNRVVLKNFIKNMIRYRGSATGIGNAAAIDIRYRQTYPEGYYQYTEHGVEYVQDTSGDVGKQIPMQFHESIDRQKTWIDVDHEAAIIYLFIIASDYFPKLTAGMTDEEKQANFEERMRRLCDLSYLQEYVRPVGMYLLPMVAQKVDPYTDITVKAVVIPEQERNSINGVTGTPNSSFVHQYDRMLFTKVENPNDELSVEPWIRTLYHSQLAGRLKNRYFKKPVYNIEGKLLYYDNDEMVSIYQDIQENVPGMQNMKIGDSLYNPNIVRAEGSYSYGPEATSAAEPESLQQTGDVRYTDEPLPYPDHAGFPTVRAYQNTSSIQLPPETDPSHPYPIYLDPQRYSQNAQGYLVDAYTGTHMPTPDTPGDGDDGTNKNLMINLFYVDEDGESEWTGKSDVDIIGKEPVDKDLIPGTPRYDVSKNGAPTGDDVSWTLKNSDFDEDTDKYIP